nr:hypothetical protein [Tanacetum cinerariifolium]
TKYALKISTKTLSGFGLPIRLVHLSLLEAPAVVRLRTPRPPIPHSQSIFLLHIPFSCARPFLSSALSHVVRLNSLAPRSIRSKPDLSRAFSHRSPSPSHRQQSAFILWCQRDRHPSLLELEKKARIWLTRNWKEKEHPGRDWKLRRSERLKGRSKSKASPRGERARSREKDLDEGRLARTPRAKEAKLPRNVKVYEGGKDSEDHLGIFSAAAEQEE